MGIEIIIAITGTLFGGISAFSAILPFLNKSSHHREMKSKLSKIRLSKRATQIRKERDDAADQNSRHWELLVDMLDSGDYILEQVKRKVLLRLLMIAAIIISAFFGIILDFPNYLSNLQPSQFQFHDLLFFLTALISPHLILVKNFFLDESEREFLIRLGRMNELFYRIFVQPELSRFNQIVDELFQKDFEMYLKDLDEMEKQLRVALTKSMLKLTSEKPTEG